MPSPYSAIFNLISHIYGVQCSQFCMCEPGVASPSIKARLQLLANDFAAKTHICCKLYFVNDKISKCENLKIYQRPVLKM